MMRINRWLQSSLNVTIASAITQSVAAWGINQLDLPSWLVLALTLGTLVGINLLAAHVHGQVQRYAVNPFAPPWWMWRQRRLIRAHTYWHIPKP